MANDHGNLVLLGGLTGTDALHRRRQLVGRPRTAFRCRQGTVSVKELPIRVHNFQGRLDLALKLCLQLVLDLLHYCERPFLQLINGEEVRNETAPKRDRKAPTWQGAQRSVAPALPWHRIAFLEVRIVQVLRC